MSTLQTEKTLNREPLWIKPFLLVILANFLLFFSMYLLLPTLPIYVQRIGGSKTIAGLVVGIFTLSAVLVRPWFGNLVDRQGRKAVLVAGILVVVLSTVGFQWTYAVWMLLLLRLVHGVGWGACSTATGTIASDVIPPLRRGEGMGYYGASTTIAMSLAPALGLRMIESYPFTLLFICSALFGLAALFVGGVIDYEGIHGVISNTKSAKKGLGQADEAAGDGAGAGVEANAKPGAGLDQGKKPKAVIVEKTAIAPSLVVFFSALTYGGLLSLLPTYAEFRGVSDVGLFFTVYALVLLVSRPLMGRWADKNGPGPVLITGTILLMVAHIVLVAADNLTWFLGVGLVYGLGFGAVQPILNAITVTLAPLERRGAANATFFSAFDLGIGLGAIALGAVSQNLGWVTMWGVSGFFAALSLIVYFTVLRGRLAARARRPGAQET